MVSINEYLLDNLQSTTTGAAMVTDSACHDFYRSVPDFPLHVKKDNLFALRKNLLREYLTGSHVSMKELQWKCRLYGMPVSASSRMATLILRIENPATKITDRSLLHFAICNIVQETIQKYFLWYCENEYDHLVFTVIKDADGEYEAKASSLLAYADSIRKHLKKWLDMDVTIVLSDWGGFPADLASFYEHGMLKLHNHVSDEGDVLVYPYDTEETEHHFPVLSALYEAPALHSLLDNGLWDEAERKLRSIFETLHNLPKITREHISGVSAYICSAFYFIAHKKNRKLSGIIDEDKNMRLLDRFCSVSRLQLWALESLERLRAEIDVDDAQQWGTLINHIHEYIDQNISDDLSLQSIADYVYLHPVYLSKIYKLRTGQGLKEYIDQCRLERAAHMLKSTNIKIVDIATQFGYNNSNYFAKVFKKKYKVSPHEFR